jgi:ketosteroid isomerase-like protein
VGVSRYEVTEFIEAGDRVVTPFTNYLRGRDGIEVQARAAFVWTMRDGAGTHLSCFQERQEALEAVGKS